MPDSLSPVPLRNSSLHTGKDALKPTHPIQRILAQGHFDGLCLIYSLFNAYKALRSPSEKASDFVFRNMNFWRRVIGNTPSLHNFVLGEGSDFGKLRHVTDAKVKQVFVSTSFEVMTDGSGVSPVVIPSDIQSLATLNFAESVAILCVKEKAEFEEGGMGDHWVAIVGRDDKAGTYLVACSYTNHQYGFHERQDDKTGRFFNTTIPVSGITKNTVYPDNINVVSFVPRP
ncbi:hypothetical protein [Pseudomonas sp. ATCC PTA-122608]|uniref:hypothetical protein n=1 Tax=Pseudomonas sp. ATCC PTA-122608 TaxID=1771311 RepID=UPI0011799856|nr:hypothetical protein [Pseudomonas sp. ATCC PTA-122608]